MNILVTGAWNCTEEQLNMLTILGHQVIKQPLESAPLTVNYEYVEAVICNNLFLYHPIERFTKLRYIQLTSAGFDRVPLSYIRKKGITIYNASGVYSIPMAEFAIGGVLQLYKQYHYFHQQQMQMLWEKRRDLLELTGKTVCVIGCGSVGSVCAKRFAGFDCRIIGVDVSTVKNGLFEVVYSVEDLDLALLQSDIVILTVPLVEETKHLMNVQRFEKMKEKSVLVNIARGEIVDTKALINALETKLLGAVLDVFEQEPLHADSPLWKMKNVIVSPHNSFVGEGNHERLFEVVIKNLKGIRSEI